MAVPDAPEGGWKCRLCQGPLIHMSAPTMSTWTMAEDGYADNSGYCVRCSRVTKFRIKMPKHEETCCTMPDDSPVTLTWDRPCSFEPPVDAVTRYTCGSCGNLVPLQFWKASKVPGLRRISVDALCLGCNRVTALSLTEELFDGRERTP